MVDLNSVNNFGGSSSARYMLFANSLFLRLTWGVGKALLTRVELAEDYRQKGLCLVWGSRSYCIHLLRQIFSRTQLTRGPAQCNSGSGGKNAQYFFLNIRSFWSSPT